jgi:hypothetical protein
MHIAVCGASTGAINIFAIEPEDLVAARELGFSQLISREVTEKVQRLPRRRPENQEAAEHGNPGQGPIPLLW